MWCVCVCVVFVCDGCDCLLCAVFVWCVCVVLVCAVCESGVYVWCLCVCIV